MELTKPQRDEWINWLLNYYFHLDEYAEFKRKNPELWEAILDGSHSRAMYYEGLRVKKRLSLLSDDGLMQLVVAHWSKRSRTLQMLAEENARGAAPRLKGTAANQDRAKKMKQCWRDTALDKAKALGYWDASELAKYIMNTQHPVKKNGSPYNQRYVLQVVREFEHAYGAEAKKAALSKGNNA